MNVHVDHSTWTEMPLGAPRDWTLDEAQADVWRIHLDDTHGDWDATCAPLSPDERRRAGSYKRRVDGERFARTRAVLRLLLGHYCRLPPERLMWQVSRQGKPQLAPAANAPPLEFNVSHSGELALVAISRRRVGVDIEQHRPGVACLAIARRYFSTAEVRQIESLAEEAQTVAFFRCWTRKEAFVKGTGNGISSGLAGFSVSLLPGEAARLTEPPVGVSQAWQLLDLTPGAGYSAALAMEGPPDARVNLRNWPPDSR